MIGDIKLRIMESWEHEITARNLERALSIVFQTTNEGDQSELNKSISDDISYSEDFRVEKTGKEIKEKLQVELASLMNKKVELVSQMQNLVKEIEQMPSGKADSWAMRGFEKYLGEVPRQYCHSQIYPSKQGFDSDVQNYISSGEIAPEIPKSTVEKMREYNSTSSNYIGVCVEIIKLETVLNNLSDSKKIKLAPTLAAQLGF